MIANVSTYGELGEVDVAHDLEGRVLSVTSDAVAWCRAPAPRLSQEEMLDLYRYMALTRAVDREIVKLSRKGIAFGKHLMCTGNEATTVGATYALAPDDWVTLAVRDLGAFLVRGVPPALVLAQACGRMNGLTGGWDGSLHMGSRALRIGGLVSHLGTMLAVGTGCAFAEAYRESDSVVLSFVGEGSTSTGDFHEALNIASVLHLPLVVVIENNQWAFGTPSRLQYAVPTLALRALAYGPHVEGCWIDGTDVVTVFATVVHALARARRERIITIIEAVSMRLEGHSLADPFMSYVPPEQLATWRSKDPIARFRDRLLTEGLVTPDAVAAVERGVAEEVADAALEAEAGAAPAGSAIERAVFVGPWRPGAAEEMVPSTGIFMPYGRAIREALIEEMDRDPDVFLVGEDIGVSGGAFKITEGLQRKYDGLDWRDEWRTTRPFRERRVIDAPIAEAGFCGLALGAALAGLRPVVEFQYADFASDAFKMIVNYAATQTVRDMGPVPVVFRLPSGWAPNTSLYHSVNPESWFASTPGLKIVAPITASDAKGLLKSAIRDDNPVLFLEYKAYYRLTPEKLPPELNLPVGGAEALVPIGKARVLREGRDLSVISYGSQVVRALAAATEVEREHGISVEVVDLRSLVPYDRAAIERSVRKTGRALVTCEAPRTGCFGNTIVADLMATAFECLDAPIRLVAAADTPVPFAPALEAAHLPTVEKLVAAMCDLARY